MRLLLLIFPVLCFLLLGERAHAFFPPASSSAFHGLSTNTAADLQRDIDLTWGPDLSGGINGVGGVGGLLASTHYEADGTTVRERRFYVADPQGNISTITDGQDQVRARYTYSAFGSVLTATGDLAAANPWRFSSKPIDLWTTGFAYYGYRDYDPQAGRWLSRDPLAEAGGLNLTGFVDNDPVNDIDYLGMCSPFWDGVGSTVEGLWDGLKSLPGAAWDFAGDVITDPLNAPGRVLEAGINVVVGIGEGGFVVGQGLVEQATGHAWSADGYTAGRKLSQCEREQSGGKLFVNSLLLLADGIGAKKIRDFKGRTKAPRGIPEERAPRTNRADGPEPPPTRETPPQRDLDGDGPVHAPDETPRAHDQPSDRTPGESHGNPAAEVEPAKTPHVEAPEPGTKGSWADNSGTTTSSTGGPSVTNADFKQVPAHLTSHPDAHSLGRHGGAVTDAQLMKRARTGVAPDGHVKIKNGQVLVPSTSSAFHSNSLLVKADDFLRAGPLADAILANPNKTIFKCQAIWEPVLAVDSRGQEQVDK